MNNKKDISEDDKIEKALKHAEKRFRKCFITIAVSLIIWPFGLHWYLRDTILEPVLLKLMYVSIPLGIIGVIVYLGYIFKIIFKEKGDS